MEKIIVGPINSGLRNNVEPFNIDNDSFPTLINALQWRGRVKRKRGTKFFGRLQVINQAGNSPVRAAPTLTQTTDGTNTLTIVDVLADPGVNLRATYTNGEISPGSVTIVVSGLGGTFVDTGEDGILLGANTVAGTSTINYSTGRVVIVFITPPGAGQTITVAFNYYPLLPVMGIDDFALKNNDFPGTIAFDPRNSYNIDTAQPYNITDTNYYKNPSSSGSYVEKGTWTPFHWNGQDYQQFWTTNYEGSLWATNGIDTPFTGATIGLQFATISAIALLTPNTVLITISIPNVLVQGDFVFVNEVVGMQGINWQTGYVTAVVNGVTADITVVFPSATITGAYGGGGIVQSLTNSFYPDKDVIRYYDGSPTAGSITALNFVLNQGWVNFMPPLSQSPFTIGDAPARIYYLVGARMILPFKDRLLFIGPVIQSSTLNALPIYLQDTVVYSSNGTPYYNASYTNTPTATIDLPTSATNNFVASFLVPTNQTAVPPTFFADSTGFGGYVSAGLDQPIITADSNQDVIMMGFNPSYQSRFVYTGNDIIPFNFFTVNSELGSSSTFSIINMDTGVITKGPRSYTIASQVAVKRIDLQIPDEVFEVNLKVNGNERFCAYRDFINEWIYFTYPGNTIGYKFPNTTLFYNYRDDSWATFYECYTAYGNFRPRTGLTWNTLDVGTWAQWNAPWNSGETTLLNAIVLAGNQQGFLMKRHNETGEGTSLFIQSISGSTVTSPNHCLNAGDYILISDASGTIGALINGKVFSVYNTTDNTFDLNPSIDPTGLTYFGNGLITRYYIPQIQTKQFPTSWGYGRKTRLGTQQYLLSKTTDSQITLQIFLSQDAGNAWNDGPIVPDSVNIENSGLVYSQVLFTCPESTNLGLTAANTNLQQLNLLSSNGNVNNSQQQIWHRINTSLIGDTIQVGFTLSDAQMRDEQLRYQTAEIELHGFMLDAYPSQLLS